MITKEELRKKAWIEYQDANALLKQKRWDNAVYICGYAIELLLKARLCIDLKLPGFPESKQECKAFSINPHGLFTHDLETLLNQTILATQLKHAVLKEWSTCLQWDPELRYQPLGTFNEIMAKEMIRSTRAVLEQIRTVTGLEGYDAAELAATNDPHQKLRVVEQQLCDEFGEFALFAVWKRAHTDPRIADVVVSAPWIDEEARTGVEHVTEAVKRILPGDEIRAVCGVFALSQDHPALQQIQMVGAHHGYCELTHCIAGSLHIDHAALITCQKL